LVDPTPDRRALAAAAIKSALRIRPDLPEVRLAYAHYLYFVFRDYEQARVQLAIARAGLPNNAEAILLAALMDRRQGNFNEAIQLFNEAIALDPRNNFSIAELASTLGLTHQFRAAHEVFHRLIELFPDQLTLELDLASTIMNDMGDETVIRSALAAIPKSMADDESVLFYRLNLALADRDWSEAKTLINKMKQGGAEEFDYAGPRPVSLGFYCVLLARLQGEQFSTNSAFTEIRERFHQKVQKLPANAKLLSQLAVLDALLNNKEDAISEGKRAVEMLPIFKDAVDGPVMLVNLATVYAWIGDLDLAFATLDSLRTTPGGLFYGNLKYDRYWDPLRKDPRFDKLLAELAPRD
jgi:tetratricopeptide (TPR) repeat protein